MKFEVKTRAWTLPCAVATSDEIFAVAKDLLKTEIENVSPQRLRLRLMGVRISTFVNADDKKPQQKSIVGFLQQGSSGPSQGIAPNPGKETVSHHSIEMEPPACSHSLEQLPHKVPRLQGLPWMAGQTGLQQVDVASEKQPQSFFQRAYAKKLQLQVKSLSGPDKGHGSVCSGFTQRGTDNLKSSNSAVEIHESEQGLLDSSRHSSITNVTDVSVAPPEAGASTSCETLTCPVCFGEVITMDLNVFNRHIDQCLSGVATKPHQTTDTDSESDGGGGLKGLTSKDEWIEEAGEDKERQKKSKPDEDLNDFKICETLHRPSVSRSEDTMARGTLEWCSRDEPLLDHHSFRSVHSSQRASLSHNGNPGRLTSHLESHPGHEGSTLICPVCQVPQNTDDLTVFNHHVDLCLNQEVLHKLGGHASSSSSSVQLPITAKKSKGDERDQHMARPNKGKSKRRGPPSSPPAKKAKTPGSRNTIDKFLR